MDKMPQTCTRSSLQTR